MAIYFSSRDVPPDLHPVIEAKDSPGLARWVELGLLPTLPMEGATRSTWVSRSQSERLARLTQNPFEWPSPLPIPDDLFTPEVITSLGRDTCITRAGESNQAAERLWLQLLPIWASGESIASSQWHVFDLAKYRVYSLDSNVEGQWHKCTERALRLAASRSAQFARSANYMGSKAVLANQLVDIMEALAPRDSMVLDVMCGSGAMAGAFARSRETIASDAQHFCRLLGLVQGGGMTHSRAQALAEHVVRLARELFMALPDAVARKIEEEDRVLNSELTADLLEHERQKLRSQAEVWDANARGNSQAVHAAHNSGSLLYHLYSGLYFGSRQAAELDCLRRAIDALPAADERQWALGALVCAASACAYTYGGHFAQPKLDFSISGNQRGDIREALQQRLLSVTHEFFVRLTSLARESEDVSHPVSIVPGPWEVAVSTTAEICGSRPVCMYLDPPYTRDEYSRYYHVLETIVLYAPHEVSGKGRLPKRGGPARFASSFSARRREVIETEIAKVIAAALERKWSCLWSYSNTGTASITNTLKLLEKYEISAEIFRIPHSYKAQGRRNAKQVDEFAVYLAPTGY